MSLGVSQVNAQKGQIKKEYKKYIFLVIAY